MKKSIWFYIKDYKFKSLLFKNLLSVICGVLLPLLIAVFFGYSRYNKEMNNRMSEMNQEILQRSVAVVDNIVQSVQDDLQKMIKSTEGLSFFNQKDLHSNEDIEEVVDYLKEYVDKNSYVQNVFLYSENNGVLVDKYNTKSIKDVKKKDKWYFVYQNINIDLPYILVNGDQNVFFCLQFISDNKKTGVIVLDMDLKKIRTVLESENVSQKGFLFIKDITGEILYSSQQDFYALSDKEKQKYVRMIEDAKNKGDSTVNVFDEKIVSVVTSEYPGWDYSLITMKGEFGEEVEKSRDYLYWSILIGVLLSIISTCFVTYFAYCPIKKIIEVIENPELYMGEKGKLGQADELLYITSNVLNSIDSINKAEQEAIERVRCLRNAQTRALQSQINPHFLYNTLESIKWCSVEDMGWDNRTEKAVTKLAKMCRFYLVTSVVTITLKEEVEFTRLYVDILKFRFGEKIKFEWDIDESLYNAVVTRMSIQPIIENAVSHGLRKESYYGNISISVFSDGSDIHFVVEDDGVGLTSGEIMSINSQLEKYELFQDQNVGLRNVNSRIKLMFGNEYGVTLSKSEKYIKGLKVDIKLPYIKQTGEYMYEMED